MEKKYNITLKAVEHDIVNDCKLCVFYDCENCTDLAGLLGLPPCVNDDTEESFIYVSDK
jgi:hypothetical protein